MPESDGAVGARRRKTSSGAAQIASLGDAPEDRDPGRLGPRRPLDRPQRRFDGAAPSSRAGSVPPGGGPAGCSAASLAERIRDLSRLDLADLRLQWRNRFGRNAPAHLTKPLLMRILSYRLQSDVHGDLDDDVLRLLDGVRRRSSGPGNGAAPARRIKPGAVLAREWGGRMHRVMALDVGFAWDGKTYRSLSEVARAITGVRWNGPRFFGLSAPKEQKIGRSASRTQGSSGSGETNP
jgi:Protein of unknown function (DUF2924)